MGTKSRFDSVSHDSNRMRQDQESLLVKLQKLEQDMSSVDQERDRLQNELMDTHRKSSDIAVVLQTTQEEKRSLENQMRMLQSEVEKLLQDCDGALSKNSQLQEEILDSHKQQTKMESSLNRAMEKEER